ncbi:MULTISPECIES: NDP-sugar synthase [unclassified Shewanella]|uniref:sugar phosphate nucleotidyltransferase n=1 Tax=unclassified Shewanella TaxID=196818 RepID=UPI000C8682F5|nr:MULTISPECIES: NDP-sugar synthase [unclassified Shewanella]MDO6641205.1 NDP-sugar synthase [Shewanella sp. 5_MG-2023]MDO6679481.1 NDP-sugar synthase [Shewanella sp. 4_MG-2023]MDO6775860.1 NDP-sugar synthase [Shewanella sp. 3_MG-2023]PMG29785.1 hypothetical protein BCU94_12735 [Shewanella sp. 10N.286.52.C2]PMG42855.1 hypothetical protein BCU91_06925 [Shewanella sp. 10N.286.52.B9]
MQAIVFANRNGNELAPLNQQYCPALLPLANKPLVEYTLEDLADAGISQVKMVICADAEQLEAQIGNGQQWGLNIEYFLSKPQEAVNSVLARMHIDNTTQALVVRGDILRSPCLERFVAFSSMVPTKFVHATMEQRNPGMMMLPAGWKHNQLLNWPLQTTAVDHDDSIAQVLHGQCFYLDSLSGYVAATEFVICSKIFSSKGRKHQTGSSNQSLMVEAQCELPQLDSAEVYGAIGEYTKVSHKAQLTDAVVVGKYCFIEDSQIQNSIILPNTYVGPQLSVNNKIISQDLMIDPQTSSWSKIEDQSLIATSTQSASNYHTLMQRGLMMMFYILLSPLLLTLFVGALIIKPNKPLLTETVINNHNKAVKAHKFNFNNKFFSLLPQLWLAAKGDLALFGASSKHKHLHDSNTTYGVYGPVQLNFDQHTPDEEIQMVEMEFAQAQKPLYLANILQQKFHSKQADIIIKS